jgi:hypothetical protein
MAAIGFIGIGTRQSRPDCIGMSRLPMIFANHKEIK